MSAAGCESRRAVPAKPGPACWSTALLVTFGATKVTRTLASKPRGFTASGVDQRFPGFRCVVSGLRSSTWTSVAPCNIAMRRKKTGFLPRARHTAKSEHRTTQGGRVGHNTHRDLSEWWVSLPVQPTLRCAASRLPSDAVDCTCTLSRVHSRASSLLRGKTG